jgi:phage baseplate assembly protein W
VLGAAESSTAALQNKSFSIGQDGLISFDANDCVVHGNSESEISCAVLYFENGPTQPICMIDSDSIWGLPGFSRGGAINLVFPNNISKIFGISNSTQLTGTTLVSFDLPPVEYQRSEVISRPTNTNTSNSRLVNYRNDSKSNIYIDINLLGHSHPLTGDLTYSTNQFAINQSLKNILFTSPTERPFDNIGFGGGINSLLFNTGDPTTLMDAKLNIINTITNFETRVILNEVNLSMINDSNRLSIEIIYTIKSTNQKVTFDLFLERV